MSKSVDRRKIDSVIQGYGLDLKARRALADMQVVEELCRSVRKSFPGDMDGCPEAERKFVEGYNLIWEKVMKVYCGEHGPKIKGRGPEQVLPKRVRIVPWQNPFTEVW